VALVAGNLFPFFCFLNPFSVFDFMCNTRIDFFFKKLARTFHFINTQSCLYTQSKNVNVVLATA
jgi:hypothetical protein